MIGVGCGGSDDPGEDTIHGNSSFISNADTGSFSVSLGRMPDLSYVTGFAG